MILSINNDSSNIGSGCTDYISCWQDLVQTFCANHFCVHLNPGKSERYSLCDDFFSIRMTPADFRQFHFVAFLFFLFMQTTMNGELNNFSCNLAWKCGNIVTLQTIHKDLKYLA